MTCFSVVKCVELKRNGCDSQCGVVCPTGAVVLDDRGIPIGIDHDSCVSCKACVGVCDAFSEEDDE